MVKLDIIIKSKKKAIEEVQKEQPGLVLWMDRSILDQDQIVAAICEQDRLGTG